MGRSQGAYCRAAEGEEARGGARGLRFREGKQRLYALTIPDPPLIHCMVPVKSGFSEACVVGAGSLRQAGLAGLDRMKAQAPPPPPLLHSPTAQSPPPRTSPSVRLFLPCWQALPLRPPAPEVLDWEKRRRRVPTNCLCPLPRLQNWEVGCKERVGENDLQ